MLALKPEQQRNSQSIGQMSFGLRRTQSSSHIIIPSDYLNPPKTYSHRAPPNTPIYEKRSFPISRPGSLERFKSMRKKRNKQVIQPLLMSKPKDDSQIFCDLLTSFCKVNARINGLRKAIEEYEKKMIKVEKILEREISPEEMSILNHVNMNIMGMQTSPNATNVKLELNRAIQNTDVIIEKMKNARLVQKPVFYWKTPKSPTL